MTRDFLKGIGLADDIIDKVMTEHGKGIEDVKKKFADYDDLKKQLESANATMDKFKDYDQTKADVEKYKKELAEAKQESEKKIRRMEQEANVKNFFDALKDDKGNSRKFVNDITRKAMTEAVLAEMEKEESKGKGLDALFKSVSEGKSDIFANSDNNPKPPVITPMGGNTPKGGGAGSGVTHSQPWNRWKR